MNVLGLVALLAGMGGHPHGGERIATPSVPPGVTCGPMRTLELADLPMTQDTTYSRVVAAWGEPRPEGPAGEVASYYLNCDARLWMSFEPSGQRRLTRAILLTGAFVPETRMLLDTLQARRTRRCNQVPRGRPVRGAIVARAWGPPDNEVGSGILRWTYEMANGGDAQVFPHGRFVTVSCASGRRPRRG